MGRCWTATCQVEVGRGAPVAKFDVRKARGCYIGACILPCIITSFNVKEASPDELTASGCSLVGVPCPWSYKLRRTSRGPSTTFELRAADMQQDWHWHTSGCCMWGSPGWWALKVAPC